MPILREEPRFNGIILPPSGWVLAALLVIYIFTGLIGHDPWKHDDAISIGIAYDIATHGNWLMPELAGQAYPDAPLYYWTASITAKLFSWLLPFHDAARLANAVFTLLALEFILLAARELHGKEHAAAAPLMLAGSIGFLFHAHEAQPMLAALTAHTAAYWALLLIPRRPLQATAFLAGAVATAFLANGLLPLIGLLPVILLALCRPDQRRQTLVGIAVALAAAALLIGIWLIPLNLSSPDYIAAFWKRELTLFSSPEQLFFRLPRYFGQLLWYAWPALPIAIWALWSKRRFLKTLPVALPCASFLSILLMLALSGDPRSETSLMLLPPLVLLAVAGLPTLRRGAANAFDWFGMLSFTFFAALAWIVWSALVLGWPERLARQAIRLQPGFTGQFEWIPVAFALVATLIWFWLIITSPRSPLRGIMHWMAGLTLFWLLIASLWMPYIDYGKTYRPLAVALAKAIPAKSGCIANANLSDSIRASLDYFGNIHTLPARSKAGKACHWLIVHGSPRAANDLAESGWRKVWEGNRPGDRRGSDKFRLYHRDPTDKASTIPELPQEPDQAPSKTVPPKA